MKIFKSIPTLTKHINRLKKEGKSIGFVPTMGALHKGHLSLLKRSIKDNDITVLSIFVNPKQFTANEDLKVYPRTEKNDILLARELNVDIIFYPSEKEMYPSGYLTYVNVEDLGEKLCGKNRPGHFRGVTTIVSKLLTVVRPDTLYLGQKDAQQAVIIKRMCTDLNYPVRIKTCPIIREADGLALSSRNKYLTDKQRKTAPVIYKALKEARSNISNGQRDAQKIKKLITSRFKKCPELITEYIACVDQTTLNDVKLLKGKILIAVAVKIGTTRLIDNIQLNIK